MHFQHYLRSTNQDMAHGWLKAKVASTQAIHEFRPVREDREEIRRGHKKMRPIACCTEQACQRHEALIGCVILGSDLCVQAFGLENHEGFDS
jgi:hypothetical protein